MCEQTEIQYLDGEVVWVKLGSCWWPGEVVDPDKLPPDFLSSFRKSPIAVVKFFQEDTYEYVKNISSIYKYNCSRKSEFIKKGLDSYRSKHGPMEKFPADIVQAETATNGDVDILSRDEFQEKKKESYAGLFGNPKKTPVLGGKRGRPGPGQRGSESPRISTPIRKMGKGNPDYKVHILLQGSKSTPQASELSTPSTSRAGSEPVEDRSEKKGKPDKPTTSFMSTPVASSGDLYACHACHFSTSRLNVMILHTKTHSVTYTPYTPSPVRKKPASKASPKSTPNSSKTPKARKPRKEKTDKEPKAKGQKRSAESQQGADAKKTKTDEEIKTSLLADWDDIDEEANDEANDESSSTAIPASPAATPASYAATPASSAATPASPAATPASASPAVELASPKIPVAAESPAVPIPADLTSAQVPAEASLPIADKKPDEAATPKPESSSDSKYEFCEDEDWPTEADGGRKIPRVKNPSKRKEETKSVSIDEDEMAKEVAELLSKTTVPELPSAPEPLKVEENFPEPSVVKSPDKKVATEPEASKLTERTAADKPPTKTIFKTKTFFRSRHSRSQDAIGKYVAEQLNAVSADRMSTVDLDLNGLEMAPSPEARHSPPGDVVKVARLAPKIQLKKMKAEAALAEREKYNFDQIPDASTSVIPEATSAVIPSATSSIVHKPTFVPEVPISLVHTPESAPEVADSLLYTFKSVPEVTTSVDHTSTSVPEETTALVHSASLGYPSTYFPEVTTSIVYPSTSMPEVTTPLICTSPFPEVHTSLVHTSTSIVPDPSSSFISVNETSLPEENSDKSLISKEEENVESITKNNFKDSPMKESAPLSHENIEDQETEVKSHLMHETVQEKLHESIQVETIPSKAVEKEPQMYINESTASAVDALLSVSSREADRVTKTISDDLPEDLFEDDKLDSTATINVNGMKQSDLGFNNGDVELEQVQQKIDEISRVNEMSFDYGINGDNQENNNDFVEKVELVTPEVANSVSEEVSTVVTYQMETEVIGQVTNNSTDEVSNYKFEDVPRVSEEFSNIIPEDVPRVSEQFSDVISEEVPRVSDEFSNVISEEVTEEINVVTEEVTTEEIAPEENVTEEVITDSMPSESDLQIAEALMNLPATALKNKVTNDLENQLQLPFDSPEPKQKAPSAGLLLKTNSKFESDFPIEATHDDVQSRFETEQEKSENLNAAQSLVQMSETVDHKLKNLETNNMKKQQDTPQKIIAKQNNNVDSVEQNIALLSDANKSEVSSDKAPKFKTTSSKLLKILEEPSMPKMTSKVVPSKHIITAVQGKEKILNLDVANSPLRIKPQSNKQKIIIRRAAPNKTLINNINESTKQEKLVLSRSNKPSLDGPSVQTYTIQASPDSPTDSNTIVIQQKMRKILNTPTKLQKIKPQTSLVAITPEAKPINQVATTDEALYDINSMPIVLSDDILTPESIEKMPIVMSDGNIISSPAVLPSPSKSIKPKISKIEPEKVAISALPNKPEMKTLLMNPVSDSNKVTTPNILSKSAKIRGSKPMLVIDRTTGQQKIIMAKESKDIKKAATQMVATSKLQTVGQIAAKTEKFIILPSANSPRPGRTQKIVIDPQTGKAHMLVAKASDPPMNIPDNKPVSAKLFPSAPDGSSTGPGTVMIITNSHGAQSKIVLTPQHEKMLFPNKHLTNMSQIKTIAQRQTTTIQKPQASSIQKPQTTTMQKQQTIVTTGPSAKTTRIVAKQKSAIITSKGQLIVGGRVATTAQNVVPAAEPRPVAPKRIVAAEPKKMVQVAPKTNEPLIFLQQNSGTVMQLTAAQFEHLQKTGQIVQKSAVPAQPVKENKIVVQKSVTITSNEAVHPVIQRQQKVRASRTPLASPSPAKKMKQEIALAPAPAPPPLAPISHVVPPAIAPSIAPLVRPSPPTAVATTSGYSELENFEELLPSTAIVRQSEVVTEAPPEPVVPAPAPAPAQLSDGQLLAVPGEHFGGVPGSFYLCVEDNGSLTPIDNRPLVLENNQLVPMAVEPVLTPQPERRDILEAALANSDVFHAEPPQIEVPDFRDLNANISVHSRVSETSTTLNQPIMTPVEMPTKGDAEPVVPANLEDGLAVIGVTPQTIPTSLELPITVTDPRIAPKTTDPLSSNNYCSTTLLPSHSGDMPYVSAEETHSSVRPISMPLLTEEDDGVGKSMPILTDEVLGERTASSVESALGSPSSLEARECEDAWPRRLHTPGSDSSDNSAEIPLQPSIQISVSDLSQNS